MSRILVSGYFGMGNAGDEALLAGLIHVIKKLERLHCRPPAEGMDIAVLSGTPRSTEELHGVRGISRWDPRHLISAVRWADVVITGPGGLLQDTTSWRSLCYYLGIAGLARTLGKKSLVMGCGAGPLEGRIGRGIVRWILKGLDGISLRDMDSLRTLRSCGLAREDIEILPDLGLLMDAPSPDRGMEILRREGIFSGGTLIGMAVRPVKGAAGNGFKEMLARVADDIVEGYGAHLIFMPFDVRMDEGFSRSVQAMMRRRSFILKGVWAPADLKALTGELHLMVGMRLHSLIFASTCGIPLVGISYDPKVENFLVKIGSSDFVRLQGISRDSLLEMIERAIVIGRRGGVNYDQGKVRTLREEAANRAEGFLKRFLS